MYRFKGSIRFSSMKNWIKKKLGKPVKGIKRVSKKGLMIFSLLTFVIAGNTFFWWYRATHGGLGLQKNTNKEPPQEWKIDLNEQFLDEEEIKKEYETGELTEEERERLDNLMEKEVEKDMLDNISVADNKKIHEEYEETQDPKDGVEVLDKSEGFGQQQVKPAVSALSTMAMPAMGKVITTFAVESLVYSKTLEQWNSHHGIDIAGDIGTPVKAAIEGTVEKTINNDPKLGVVVILDHGGGIKTLYGNLASDRLVKEGQTVKKGQAIGAIGNTAPYEIEDPPHLHFEVFQDGKSINPQQYLPKLN